MQRKLICACPSKINPVKEYLRFSVIISFMQIVVNFKFFLIKPYLYVKKKMLPPLTPVLYYEDKISFPFFLPSFLPFLSFFLFWVDGTGHRYCLSVQRLWHDQRECSSIIGTSFLLKDISYFFLKISPPISSSLSPVILSFFLSALVS